MDSSDALCIFENPFMISMYPVSAHSGKHNRSIFLLLASIIDLLSCEYSGSSL